MLTMLLMTHPDSELIDKAGGTGRIAKLCFVSSQAVSQWRRCGIPDARRMFLALKVPAIFGEKRGRLSKAA